MAQTCSSRTHCSTIVVDRYTPATFNALVRPPRLKRNSLPGRVDVRFRKRQPLCLNEGNIEGHTRPHGLYRPSCIIHRARAHTVARESRCRPGACPRRYAPSMTVARPVLHRPSSGLPSTCKTIPVVKQRSVRRSSDQALAPTRGQTSSRAPSRLSKQAELG